MAKKKPHDISDESFTESAVNVLVEADNQSDSRQSSLTQEPADPLMEEVQSFINLRDELAKKLAVEIEATESKLAELKQTAASLFPGTNPDATDDRKVKKPKPKSSTPKEKSESATVSDHQAVAGQ